MKKMKNKLKHEFYGVSEKYTGYILRNPLFPNSTFLSNSKYCYVRLKEGKFCILEQFEIPTDATILGYICVKGQNTPNSIDCTNRVEVKTDRPLSKMFRGDGTYNKLVPIKINSEYKIEFIDDISAHRNEVGNAKLFKYKTQKQKRKMDYRAEYINITCQMFYKKHKGDLGKIMNDKKFKKFYTDSKDLIQNLYEIVDKSIPLFAYYETLQNSYDTTFYTREAANEELTKEQALSHYAKKCGEFY